MDWARPAKVDCALPCYLPTLPIIFSAAPCRSVEGEGYLEVAHAPWCNVELANALPGDEFWGLLVCVYKCPEGSALEFWVFNSVGRRADDALAGGAIGLGPLKESTGTARK